MARIVGTEGFDVLIGTGGDDLIEGLGGPDQLTGGGGNDLLLGGNGSDRLDGGTGDDRLEGGNDNDHLTDNDGGDDLIFGEAGDDTIYVRREHYRGNVEKVEIYGGAGSDRITYWNNSALSALIDAGEGDDVVYLERTARGTAVALGAGRDTLDLSEYQFSPMQQLTLTDFQAGPNGDQINFLTPLGYYLSNWNQSLNPFGTGHLSFRQDGADAMLRIDLDGVGGLPAYDAILFKNVQASTLTLDNLDGYAVDGSTPASVQLTGTGDRDVLTGNGGRDVIDGALGDDVLKGRGGDDLLRGGGGADDIEGGAGNDTIEGGEGNDSIRDTSGGSDRLDGGDGNDSLYLYRLNHSLNEQVVLLGGAGDDHLMAWSYANGTVTMDGGTGDDRIQIWTSDNTQIMTLGAGADSIDLDSFQPFDMLSTSRVVTDFETGVAGDVVQFQNFLVLYAGWNGASNPFETGRLLLEQRGTDVALRVIGVNGLNSGQPGDVDLLVFKDRTAASFTAENFGGLSPNGVPPAGRTMIGTDAADVLTGSFGNDVIEGRGGQDNLNGSAGNDVLRGGDDYDFIRGGDGDDLMDGGAGDDWLEAVHESGADTLIGGEGSDSLSIYRNIHSSLGGAVTIDGGVGDDRVYYHNLVQGTGSIDVGAGADRVVLQAARGATRVALGEGRDEIDFDQFYVSILGNFTIDVADFRVGEDRLTWGSYFGRELAGWNQQDNPFTTGHLTLVQAGPDTLLRIDRDGRGGQYTGQLFATFRNVTASSLTRADFGGLPPDGSDVDRILTGGAGNDVLTGGTGHDLLTGGAGDDRLAGRAGNDTVEGGDGIDTLMLTGARRDYALFRHNGQSFVVGAEGADRVTGVERVRFANADVSWAEFEGAAKPFDGLRYVAGYRDLAASLGTDPAAGAAHFAAAGMAEGRNPLRFDWARYVASYSDLVPAIGADADAATRHFIQYGGPEGRSWTGFSPFRYVAGYADLMPGMGADPDAAAQHYVRYGFAEGRSDRAFDTVQYVASYADLIPVIGLDSERAAEHFVRFGAAEGRRDDAFDGLRYIASSADLIGAIGADADRGAWHYVTAGFAEGRNATAFDPAAYLSRYSDLSFAFGTDTAKATLHYIRWGYAEGRTDGDGQSFAVQASAAAPQHWAATPASAPAIEPESFTPVLRFNPIYDHMAIA